jgi:hypothetical protein
VQSRDERQFAAVTDCGLFRQHPHPNPGRIATAIRRFSPQTQEHFAPRQPRRALMALRAEGSGDRWSGMRARLRRNAGLNDSGTRLVIQRFRGRTIPMYIRAAPISPSGEDSGTLAFPVCVAADNTAVSTIANVSVRSIPLINAENRARIDHGRS